MKDKYYFKHLTTGELISSYGRSISFMDNIHDNVINTIEPEYLYTGNVFFFDSDSIVDNAKDLIGYKDDNDEEKYLECMRDINDNYERVVFTTHQQDVRQLTRMIKRQNESQAQILFNVRGIISNINVQSTLNLDNLDASVRNVQNALDSLRNDIDKQRKYRQEEE